MRKGTLLSSGLITILLVALIPTRSIVTAGAFDWASFIAVEETTSTTNSGDTTRPEDTQTTKKKGGFMHALGAPFRALGRLFGGGDKNKNQVRRITDKDLKKFETNKVARIQDSTIEVPAPVPAPVAGKATPVSAQTPTLTPADLYLQKGRDQLQSGNVDQAILELTNAITLNPNLAEADNLLGIAYESKGFRESAIRSLKTAVTLDRDNAQYLNNLGFILTKTNDTEVAIKYLKRASKLAPNDARIWNNLGLAQAKREKFDDAFESFTKAVGEFNAHLNIASLLTAHGYGKDAIKHLEKAYAMNPQSIEALDKLASLYATTGRLTDAENARRSLVALRTFADAKQNK